MQNERERIYLLSLCYPHLLPLWQSCLYIFLLFIDPSTILLWHMEMNNPSKLLLHLRMSSPMEMEVNLPKLLIWMSTPPLKKRKRNFKRVDWEIENFRKGECSRFQVLLHVANKLRKWAGASEKEKGKAFDSYLAEINSFLAVQDEDRSASRDSPPPSGVSLPAGNQLAGKRIWNEVEDLLDQVSRGELEGEEPDQWIMWKRVREEEMPWYNPAINTTWRSSCIETCRTFL